MNPVNETTPRSPEQVIFTNKAHCRDCYRCLRVCPVKAIRMDKGQASVVAERCIGCGTCIRECPQGAKSYRNDVERATRLIAREPMVAASLAPSFVALFTEWESRRLPSALRSLGFSHVSETAIGAYAVAAEMARIVAAEPDRAHIGSACPALVRYIECYEPERLGSLMPVVSPMLAHARHIKEQIPGARVVFIGPCVAKKSEAERPENKGLVDLVLTFAELLEWMERQGIDLAACEESSFDEQPRGEARYFPLVGGCIRTASLNADLLSSEIETASGPEEIHELLQRELRPGVLIEPLFCRQGCVSGPAMPGEGNAFDRRNQVLDYARKHTGLPPGQSGNGALLRTAFQVSPVNRDLEVREEAIRQVLEKTGKAGPEDHLDCGACGYPTCREKAIAVLRGMAEVEMCIPNMRRLAEQRTDRIIETSPNGIVILDERLQILSMNPAFRRYFMCTEAVCGRPISYLMDPDPFEKLATGREDALEMVVRHDRYNLIAHEVLYRLPEEKQLVGIFVNITNSRANKEKLDQLRSQTVMQARELLDHQIQMAQTIARFLGESTARGEDLVEKLIELGGDEAEESRGKGNQWLWDMYTSK